MPVSGLHSALLLQYILTSLCLWTNCLTGARSKSFDFVIISRSRGNRWTHLENNHWNRGNWECCYDHRTLTAIMVVGYHRTKTAIAFTIYLHRWDAEKCFTWAAFYTPIEMTSVLDGTGVRACVLSLQHEQQLAVMKLMAQSHILTAINNVHHNWHQRHKAITCVNRECVLFVLSSSCAHQPTCHPLWHQGHSFAIAVV